MLVSRFPSGGLKLLLALGVVMMLLTALPLSPAQAHAGYATSDPLPDSNLKAAPTTVSITFLENVAPSGLSIVVYDNTGKVVSTGTATINPKNEKQAFVAMKGDDSDIYRVDWQNVSADDNDPTIGAFVFGVNTDKVSAPSTPKATSDSGVAPLVAALIGLAGIIIGAGGAYYLLRSRTV